MIDLEFCRRCGKKTSCRCKKKKKEEEQKKRGGQLTIFDAIKENQKQSNENESHEKAKTKKAESTRLVITGDGTELGTKITTEGGEIIHGVVAFELTQTSDAQPRLQLWLVGPKFNVTCDDWR